MKTEKKKITEDEVLKALEELEENVEKGKIPDEMKNPNGGLATEGKDLEDEISASEGEPTTKTKKSEGKPEVFKGAKPKMKKNDSMSDEESGDESNEGEEDSSEEEMSKATSASDEGSEDGMKKKKKSMKKSFRETAEESPEIKKAMDVSNFIEGLVDQISDAEAEMTKALVELQEEQTGFNGKLAKAMVAIGRRLVKTEEVNTELLSMVKGLTDKLEVTPDPARGRKSVLKKGDIVERNVAGMSDENAEVNHQDPRTRKAMCGWLMQKAMTGKIAASIVTQYESGYAIDPSLIKEAESDLKKALG